MLNIDDIFVEACHYEEEVLDCQFCQNKIKEYEYYYSHMHGGVDICMQCAIKSDPSDYYSIIDNDEMYAAIDDYVTACHAEDNDNDAELREFDEYSIAEFLRKSQIVEKYIELVDLSYIDVFERRNELYDSRDIAEEQLINMIVDHMNR